MEESVGHVIHLYGKDSKVGRVLRQNYLKDNVEIIGIRDTISNAVYSAASIKLPLAIISINVNQSDKIIQLLEIISQNYEKIVVICSSTALNARRAHFRYSINCSRMVKKIENSGFSNVYPLCYGEFIRSGRFGALVVSEDLFYSTLKHPEQYLRMPIGRIDGKLDKVYERVEKIFGIKVTAFIYKHFTKYSYGVNRF